MITNSYDYLRMATSILLVLSIILSTYLMWYFSVKKIITQKSPKETNNNFLTIWNGVFISLIAFSFIVMIVDFAYITNFLNRLPKYAIIIPVLIERISYQIFIMYVNEKNK